MAGSDYFLVGLSSIAMADCRASNPGMPATLTSIANIAPNTAFIALANPSKTEFRVEDSDFPVVTINQAGEKTVEFATYDLQPANFSLGLGGSSGATYWKAPNDAVIVTEKSIRLVSKVYNNAKYTIDLVHCNLRAGANLRFSQTELGMLTFQADILRPRALNTDAPIYARIE